MDHHVDSTWKTGLCEGTKGPSWMKKSMPVTGVLSTSRTEPSSGLRMKAICSPRRTCAPACFTRRRSPADSLETVIRSLLLMTLEALPPPCGAAGDAVPLLVWRRGQAAIAADPAAPGPALALLFS